ncbi:MAG: diacylglycerol/lipid kinase family protein, partial [Ktedonobacterales bacterium]
TFSLANFVLPVPVLDPRGLARRRARRATRRESPVAPRVRIIVNPASGTAQQIGLEELEDVVDWLEEQGIPAELCPTERSGHAAELAREAVKAGMDMVVAAGGDGTVNDIIQALAGHTTALGVLPMGTVNVWAREMNIPLNTVDAREVLLHGVRRRVDLGRAGTRYFLMMSGIGFDAEVARRVELKRSWLKRLGLKLLNYLATAGILSVTHPSTRIWMRSDAKRSSVNALMVLIGNTRLYGGALTFTNKALADDGMLDVVVISSGGVLYRLGVLARAALRRPSLGPRVRYLRARSLRLESAMRVPVQVDGEVIGTLPMTFTVMPSALTVVVPKDAPAALFVHEPLTTPPLKAQ